MGHHNMEKLSALPINTTEALHLITNALAYFASPAVAMMKYRDKNTLVNPTHRFRKSLNSIVSKVPK